LKLVVLAMAATCYLCPESDSHFVWNTKSQIRSPWELLKDAEDTNGHDISLNCCGNLNPGGPKGTVHRYFNFKYRKQFDKFEDELWNNKELIVVSMAARNNNVSVIYGNTDDGKPSLVIKSNGINEYPKPKLTMSHFEELNFMYCRTRNLKKKSDILSALHSPFDVSIWAVPNGPWEELQRKPRARGPKGPGLELN